MTGRDDSGIELQGSGNNESIHGVGRRQLGAGQEMPGLLSDSAREIEDDDANLVG